MEQKSEHSSRGFLSKLEKWGDKLPDPVLLFIFFSAFIVVISGILASWNVQATLNRLNMQTGELETRQIMIASLLNVEGLRYIVTQFIPNFVNFPPLGVVIVAIVGVGLLEHSGLIQVILRRLVMATPPSLVSFVVVFTGVLSNLASDAGYVMLIPLGAIIFISFKRHPLAGMAAAFAGVSGGYSANLVFGPFDAMISGLSTEASKIIQPVEVAITSNWYFLAVSSFIVSLVGMLITDFVVEPHLGKYQGAAGLVHADEIASEEQNHQKKGLRWAFWTFLALGSLLLFLSLPEGAPLRDPSSGELLGVQSPFIKGIIVLITVIFGGSAIAFGFGSGSFKNTHDVVSAVTKSLNGMGSYLLLALVASQFISYFNYTQIGTYIAIKGAEFLESVGLTGISAIIVFVFLSAFINLFMGSGSAKWAILAPIFVPMLMQLDGFSPAFIQMAYRIGDSTTNIISPFMLYFPLVIAYMQKYEHSARIGRLVSLMIPYSISFLLSWTLLLVLWFYLGFPLGPGGELYF